MTPDPYRYFRIESRELLDQMGQGVLDLEKGDAAAEIVARLLRQAHTLKGAARVVRQSEIADLAHGVEDVLSPFRDQPAVPPDRIDLLLQRLDAIDARVRTLGQAAADSPAAREAHGPAQAQAAQAAAVPAGRPLDEDEVETLLGGITETYVQVSSLRRVVTTVERVRHLAELAFDQTGAPGAQRKADAASAKLRAVIDDLRAMVGGVERSLAAGLEQVSRELRQVRETAERLRLVPAQAMFVVLERTARDAASGQGKRVAFEASGGDVRLSPQVLTAMQGALVQAVRNAVVHGVEPEAERAAAGKPPAGAVSVQVSRRGSRVVFVCRDDGRGVDLEAARRALIRGGAAADDVNRLDAESLLRRMLRGGVSTAGAVSELAGRGVGLDVIREAMGRLEGQVEIRTEAGRGTTLEMAVPLSMSSMDALLVKAGEHAAAIPLSAVRRAVRLTAAELAHSATGATMVLDGRMIPFVPLSHSLRGGGAGAALAAGRTWTAVVIQGGGGRQAALGVDRLLGAEEIVVRPLPALTPADPVVVGASLDAAGNPQIVLDPERLVAGAEAAIAPEVAPPARPPILVVDDSMTTRMLEQSILESAGYTVETAGSAEEAYEKALAGAYGLFLVDVEMPGMDGFTFVQRTRADPALRGVPAILVTSRDAPEDRRRGLDAGASAYVVKSEFDQADLLQRIGRLLG